MSTIESHLPFEIEINVDESDIDQLGHVNNTVYLRWVQDAATAHWSVIANEEEQKSLLWVVVKHEIEYKRPAFLHDNIITRTWIGGIKRRYFERFTEIKRFPDNKVLATALTLWCPVDAQNKKPIRASDELKAKFSTFIE